jgi:hypothetical protein
VLPLWQNVCGMIVPLWILIVDRPRAPPSCLASTLSFVCQAETMRHPIIKTIKNMGGIKDGSLPLSDSRNGPCQQILSHTNKKAGRDFIHGRTVDASPSFCRQEYPPSMEHWLQQRQSKSYPSCIQLTVKQSNHRSQYRLVSQQPDTSRIPSLPLAPINEHRDTNSGIKLRR